MLCRVQCLNNLLGYTVGSDRIRFTHRSMAGKDKDVENRSKQEINDPKPTDTCGVLIN